MNRTLLLILCDFLLLNLLALTRWERAEPTRPTQAPVPELAAGAQNAEDDLVAAMQLALADEQATRLETAADLAAREQALAALQEERADLSQTLAQTLATAEQLSGQVAAATRQATVTQAELDRMRRELDARNAESARQQLEVERLTTAQAEAQERIQGLTVAVRVAEQQTVLLQETAETFRQQAAAERAERERVQETTVQLAQGVGQLAESSTELRREIQENRPINTNVLFSRFLENRVNTRIAGARPTLISSGAREREARTILVRDGAQTYAVLHVDDTPFLLMEPFLEWTRLQVEFLTASGSSLRASSVNFLSLDPRLVAIPVTPEQVTALGVTPYETALDPVKFPDAVLISGGGNGYGELPFRLDASQPGYVRVDNRVVRRLFGDFSPSRGDLVLSRTGELLGIMVNSDYCALVTNFLPTRTLTTGEDLRSQNTSTLFTDLTARLRSLPLRLQ
jgi:hypothetical protein